MKNKSLLIFLWSSSILMLLLVILAYYFKFKENGISNDPEKWAQFADYFGGILNPFISLINLVILTYLSIRLVKNEDERNKWTLQELARPYGELSFISNANSIELLVHNFGLGPMVISEIIIKGPDGKTYDNFEELILADDKSIIFQYSTFKVSNNHCAIAKDGEIRLLKISGSDNNYLYMNHFRSIISKLNKMSIVINYSDMYKRPMDPLVENPIYFKI